MAFPEIHGLEAYRLNPYVRHPMYTPLPAIRTYGIEPHQTADFHPVRLTRLQASTHTRTCHNEDVAPDRHVVEDARAVRAHAEEPAYTHGGYVYVCDT